MLSWAFIGGGNVVTLLTFYSDDPSLNPAELYNFKCKNYSRLEQKQTKWGRE